MEKSKGESMANMWKVKGGGKCNWSGLSDGDVIEEEKIGNVEQMV